MQWPHMNMNYPSLKQHTSKPFPQRIEKLWHNQICPGTVISNHLPHPEASSPHDPTPSSATPWIDHVRFTAGKFLVPLYRFQSSMIGRSPRHNSKVACARAEKRRWNRQFFEVWSDWSEKEKRLLVKLWHQMPVEFTWPKKIESDPRGLLTRVQKPVIYCQGSKYMVWSNMHHNHKITHTTFTLSPITYDYCVYWLRP